MQPENLYLEMLPQSSHLRDNISVKIQVANHVISELRIFMHSNFFDEENDGIQFLISLGIIIIHCSVQNSSPLLGFSNVGSRLVNCDFKYQMQLMTIVLVQLCNHACASSCFINLYSYSLWTFILHEVIFSFILFNPLCCYVGESLILIFIF